jgi:hypothetical protein
MPQTEERRPGRNSEAHSPNTDQLNQNSNPIAVECNPSPRQIRHLLDLRWEENRRLPPLEDGSRSPFRRFMEMPIVTPMNPCGPTESVDTHSGVRLTCARRCHNICPFAESLQGAA